MKEWYRFWEGEVFERRKLGEFNEGKVPRLGIEETR
jgi:hypothetical protein